jgi:guanine deaminase
LPDLSQLILGPLLNPRSDGKVDFIPDAALACDAAGTITYVGPRASLPPHFSGLRTPHSGLLLPPMLDAHIHIPQHPIRGQFMDGVSTNPPEGRLIAGLNRNVFPTEAKCSQDDYTQKVVDSFLADTLSKGVIGGAAYMTVHPQAVRIALRTLPTTWSVGLVLMNMNCPEYLRTTERTLEEDVRALAEEFGKRLILTDRFAVSVDTPLRGRAVKLADELGLRMQTHLNEQIPEKRFVEEVLYPSYRNYTDVYDRDGLLDCDYPILAHCVRMSQQEFDVAAMRICAIAHCPTSNTLLGSGVMPLDQVNQRHMSYAICTDVGASPTVSLLAEMSQYLKVHATAGQRPAPSDALWRTTLGPAQILRLDHELGTFTIGRPLSYVQIEPSAPVRGSADETIQLSLLDLSEQELAAALLEVMPVVPFQSPLPARL